MIPGRPSPSVLASALALTLLPQAAAQSPDTPEPGSSEAIAAATTEARFVTPWVAYVPDVPGVPSPTKHLGGGGGAPGELSNRPRSTPTIARSRRTRAPSPRRCA